MKEILSLILLFTTLSATATEITIQDYEKLFDRYNACFILYNINEQKIVTEYNPDNRCNQRISPDSTFKIPLSLIAFDQDIINQTTVFKWDGQKGVVPEHDQDQSPNSWLKYSVVWVSQQLSNELGKTKMKYYLASFNYGNQDFSGDPGKNNGLTHSWLSSSLKISAIEQLNFLNAMLSNKLPISKGSVENTKNNLYQGKLDNGFAYYGKTGSGRNGQNERMENPSNLRDGWFIGFIENDSKHYIFVSNLTDKQVQASIDKGSLQPFGSQILKPITIQLLNTYFKT